MNDNTPVLTKRQRRALRCLTFEQRAIEKFEAAFRDERKEDAWRYARRIQHWRDRYNRLTAWDRREVAK